MYSKVCFDAGDPREEGEHFRETIEKISSKPLKEIIYSHSHNAMGAGAPADDPDKVQLAGDRSEVTNIFGIFDKFNPTEYYIVPPLED